MLFLDVFLDENLGCCFQLGQIYLIIKWLYRSLLFRCETEDVLVQHISGAADDLENNIHLGLLKSFQIHYMFERPEINETKLFTMEISSTQLGAFSEVLEVSTSSIWSIGLIPSCSLGATVLIGRYSHLRMKVFGMDRLDEHKDMSYILSKLGGGSSSPPNHGDSCPPKKMCFFH